MPLIFQFVVSLTLISYLLVQALQLKFLSGFDSGIETENRLVITLNRNLMMKYRRFIGNIEEIPGVISVSGKATRFGGDYGADIRLPGWDQETKLVAYGYCVQDNFFEVMGIDLIEGKSFSNYPVRDSSRFIIDKYTANLLGLEDPVGSIIRDDFITGEIVGVVENTNLVSLNKEKRPVVYNQIKDYSSELLINYSGSIENIISSLEKVLTSFDPDYILEYDTLGERMAGFYKNERSNLKLTSWLTALALILCLSGVYSIVSNRVEKERKNISIKKILGASMNDLHTYFGKEIFYLLLLSAAISVPIAYFMSVNWLSDYTERIRIGLLPFVFSLLIVTLLSVLITLIKHNTISSLNPVENLKTE